MLKNNVYQMNRGVSQNKDRRRGSSIKFEREKKHFMLKSPVVN